MFDLKNPPSASSVLASLKKAPENIFITYTKTAMLLGRSKAHQIDSCQHYPTSEIPEGLERSFPFFLDSRQPIEAKLPAKSSLTGIDHMEMTVFSCHQQHVSSSRFDVGISIKNLLNGTVNSGLNKDSGSSCTAGNENVPSSKRRKCMHRRSKVLKSTSLSSLSKVSGTRIVKSTCL